MSKHSISLIIIVSILATVSGNRLLAGGNEQVLSGSAISDWLTGNTAISTDKDEPSKQTFLTNGTTRYLLNGRPVSDGFWRIQGNRYCSNWPPSTNWLCYQVTGKSNETARILTFISANGKNRYPVRIEKGVLF